MAETNPPEILIELDRKVLGSSNVVTNISQEYLITTIDKVKLCLLEHQGDLRAQSGWILPTGIFIPVVATLVAAQFNDFLGLSAAVWNAIYLLAAFISGVWLLNALRKAWRSRKRGSVEALVNRLKENR